MSSDKSHWELCYRAKSPEAMSWYEAEPALSLGLLQRGGLSLDSSVIDVGGGASTLVDRLLETGAQQITVLDIAGAALAASRSRLGQSEELVTWCEADILAHSFAPAAYDLWHDRAVFHFLIAREDRARYVSQCTRALRAGGALVIGTFADDGPTRCSGLDVVRYSAASLAVELGAGFDLCESMHTLHRTPGGVTQAFLYTRWVMTPHPPVIAAYSPPPIA